MKKRVLFLCTQNACRSQMAEGLLRDAAGERYEVFSAGQDPAGLNPLAVKVMKEAGIDISRQRSKALDEFKDAPFDFVITVCSRAARSCPVFPASCKKLSWDIEDPAAAQGEKPQRLQAFRKIMDELKKNIDTFLRQSSS